VLSQQRNGAALQQGKSLLGRDEIKSSCDRREGALPLPARAAR
jgi:hypothetical protein